MFIGNGVSELITMVLQAFLDGGSEILVPARTIRCGPARSPCPAARRCTTSATRPTAGTPDLAEVESKVTENTHGLVIINPNNPRARSTARRPSGLIDIARRHDLVVFADEIYEKIIFDDAVHHHAATFAGSDVLCLTFSGLFKAYRVAATAPAG